MLKLRKRRQGDVKQALGPERGGIVSPGGGMTRRKGGEWNETNK